MSAIKAFDIIFGWNRGDVPPKINGEYYVAKIRADKKIEIVTYTFDVNLGWNTLFSQDPANALTLENYFWHPIIEI